MSNFRIIETGIHPQPILNQIEPEMWQAVSKLQNISGDLNPYGFLPLTMGVVKNKDDNIKNSSLQQNTPLYSHFTQLHSWFKSKGIKKHSRMAFFRLKPGDTVGLHIDDGTYYLPRDRYHLSLQGRYQYTVDNESKIIEPGTFFWFDNKKPHTATNIGDVDRITLVFDVPKHKNNP
jgi:quercetin dioxygenase-like cupin family protein